MLLSTIDKNLCGLGFKNIVFFSSPFAGICIVFILLKVQKVYGGA